LLPGTAGVPEPGASPPLLALLLEEVVVAAVVALCAGSDPSEVTVALVLVGAADELVWLDGVVLVVLVVLAVAALVPDDVADDVVAVGVVAAPPPELPEPPHPATAITNVSAATRPVSLRNMERDSPPGTRTQTGVARSCAERGRTVTEGPRAPRARV
jgi:hypothetical protein